jgi:hypothetical protein
VFKRLFGKPDDGPSGLNMNRVASSGPAGDAGSRSDSPDIQIPSRKPPPNLKDLVLPETLAQESQHPREVHVNFPLSVGTVAATSTGPVEIGAAQIEAIAQRVADKLSAGVLGDRLRETVARIVSETSERLVRDEIARIRAEADRE